MKPNKTKELDILNEGRRPVAVIFADGTTAVITVKKVGLVQMSALAAAQTDLRKEAACYIESAEARQIAARLTDESLLDVVELGQEVNDPLLHRWLKLQEKKLKASGLDIDAIRSEAVEKITAKLLAEEGSGTSSPDSSKADTASPTS